MPELSLIVLAALVFAGVHALVSLVPRMPSSVALGLAFFCGVWLIFFGGKYVSG